MVVWFALQANLPKGININRELINNHFDSAHKKHEEMGCICFENPEMGIYFIEDPDGYWLEILP